jgi:tRNA(fMet)-specific endonuclease VapC
MVNCVWLLDTNIISEATKESCNANVLLNLARYEAEIALPSLVLHELRYGWLKMSAGKKKDAIGHYLQTVVSVLPVFDYDAKAARIHARLRADSEKAGKTLPFVDGQIAAIAISHGLTLVTRNSKDFSGIDNLQLANWFE